MEQYIKVRNKKTNQIYAAKICNVISNMDSVKKKIHMLKQCNSSQYTIKYYSSYTKSVTLWIIIEYYEGGIIQE